MRWAAFVFLFVLHFMFRDNVRKSIKYWTTEIKFAQSHVKSLSNIVCETLAKIIGVNILAKVLLNGMRSFLAEIEKNQFIQAVFTMKTLLIGNQLFFTQIQNEATVNYNLCVNLEHFTILVFFNHMFWHKQR